MFHPIFFRRRRFFPVLFAVIFLSVLLPVLLTACASRPHRAASADGAPNTSPDGPLARANPGYIQWLERQTMLRQAPDLTAIVSGSSLAWNAPSTENDAAALLNRADIWLDLPPRLSAWSGDVSALGALKKIDLPHKLAAIGIHGLYLSSAAESGSDWDAEGAFMENADDAVSFRFAPFVGKDEDWQELEDLALSQTAPDNGAGGVLLGGDILPAATGLGPDFFLAVRGVRDYPGLYMMVEVPSEFWPLLPLSRLTREGGSSVGEPLPEAARKAMEDKALIPPAFSRDADPGRAISGGWAVTSEIVGVDGVNRRWLYRWVGSPRRPVLNWDDPSGAARRLFSASVIRQVGLLHQPLVGLSVAALWGQDAAKPSSDNAAAQTASFHVPAWTGSPEPALSALQSLSRDVRRYGAWSLLRDPVPAPQVPLAQTAGVDFVRDTITSPALEYALLTGDTAPLKQALADSLTAGVDHARLWRSPADGKGLNFESAGLSGRKAVADLAGSWRHDLLMKEGEPLPINAFTLAAAATGVTPEALRNAAHAASLGVGADGAMSQVKAAHMLQIAFRAMQPGLLMIGGGDVTGILALPENSPAAWVMDGAAMVATRQGITADAGLYPPLEAQPDRKDSFGHELTALAAIRREIGVASGKLTAVPDMGEASAAGVLTRLPDGDYLLCAGNFSGASFVTDVNFPEGLVPVGGPAHDLVTGNRVAVDKNHLRLRMAPWQYRIVSLKGAR